MKVKVIQHVRVYSANGKEIFPNIGKTIPAGSFIQINEEFKVLETEHKWVKSVNNQSDCTGTFIYNVIEWNITEA